jgi:hypothetical protein
MKKLLGVIFLGLLLLGCAPNGQDWGQWIDQAEKPINKNGGHVSLYGDPPITKITPIANGNCQNFDSQSKAINIRQFHKGAMLSGSEFSYWHYDCETALVRKEKNKIELASLIDESKATCKTLGFKEGSDKFADCTLKLYAQSVEIAAKQNQQIVVQGKSSGYDPVRDKVALMAMGLALMSGNTATTTTTTSSSGPKYFLSSSYVSGMNRICIYKFGSAVKTKTMNGITLCPMSY